MIVDAVMLGYATDLDLLDIRLHELADVVDRFIVVEAGETFTGRRKPLHLYHARRRFAAFADRLEYVTLHALPAGDAWAREAYQRNAILAGLKDAADDDIVLVGDVDEIPSAAAVREAAVVAAQGHQVAFEQTLCLYYVNNIEPYRKWYGTQDVRYDYLKRVTPQGVRDFRNHTPCIVKDGGWHFSSLVLDDPVGRLTAKIQAFSHQEVNRPDVLDPANIRERVALGQDIQGRTDVRFSVRRDAVLPRYVVENKSKFERLFYPGTL